MRVAIVKPGEPLPGDLAGPLRAGALAEDLAAAGHDVVWWTSSFDWRTHELVYDSDVTLTPEAGHRVRVLTSSGYESNVSARRLVDSLHYAARLFVGLFRSERPDVVVACSPPAEAAIAAGIFARLRRVPFVVDVRDQWVENYRLHLLPALPSWCRPVAWRLVRFQAWMLFRLATATTAISESFAAWVHDEAERDSDVIPIGLLRGPSEEAEGTVADPKIVWYCGSLNTGVDFAPVIEAAHNLVERGEDRVAFVVSGSGIHEAELTAAAQALPNLEFTGWVGPEQRTELQQTAWCGLMPRIDVEYSAMGNKYFEYFGAGLPVLTNDPGVLDEIEDEGLGVGYGRRGRAALEDVVVALLDDPARMAGIRSTVIRRTREDLSRVRVAERFELLLERLVRGQES